MYLTDCLRLLTETAADTCRSIGTPSRYVSTRYVDIVKPPKEETRTAEEIKAHILKKLRG